MKIAVDCRGLNVAFVRGMGRYLLALLEQANQITDWSWEFYSDRPDLPFLVPTMHHSQTSLFELRGCRFHTWEQYGLPARVKRSQANVLFCPNTTLPWWQPIPTVVTVHDTIPWDSKEFEAGQSWYWHWLLPRALRKAAAA